MSKGLVFFGKPLGLRSQNQRGYAPAFLTDGLQNFGQLFGVFRLSKEKISRIGRNLFSDVAVGRASQENVVAIADEILLQKTGNKVFLNIEDRSHEK